MDKQASLHCSKTGFPDTLLDRQGFLNTGNERMMSLERKLIGSSQRGVRHLVIVGWGARGRALHKLQVWESKHREGCAVWKHDTVIITHTHTVQSLRRHTHTQAHFSVRLGDGGHNYHHAICVNSRQLTAAQRAASAPRCHKHLVRCLPDVPKHN